MTIDWITVLAQLANFLLLVWLLRRFLYRPILDGIDAREAEITRRMASADAARVQAKEAEQRYQRAHTQVLTEQERRVAQALDASREQREQMLADARSQIERQRRDWQRYQEQEDLVFRQHLQRAGGALLLELTRKALNDLADTEVEVAIVRQFHRQLPSLAAELNAAAGTTRQGTVHTQAALPEVLRQQLRGELHRLLPQVALEFEVDPRQAPGLVLQVGGARLAWTTDSYMDALDEATLRPEADTLLAMPGEPDAR